MPNDILIKKKIKPFINKIFVTSDKSLSIRCVLLASIAIGTSKIENLLESEDVLNTLRAVKKLGIKYKKKKKKLYYLWFWTKWTCHKFKFSFRCWKFRYVSTTNLRIISQN